MENASEVNVEMWMVVEEKLQAAKYRLAQTSSTEDDLLAALMVLNRRLAPYVAKLEGDGLDFTAAMAEAMALVEVASRERTRKGADRDAAEAAEKEAKEIVKALIVRKSVLERLDVEKGGGGRFTMAFAGKKSPVTAGYELQSALARYGHELGEDEMVAEIAEEVERLVTRLEIANVTAADARVRANAPSTQRMNARMACQGLIQHICVRAAGILRDDPHGRVAAQVPRRERRARAAGDTTVNDASHVDATIDADLADVDATSPSDDDLASTTIEGPG